MEARDAEDLSPIAELNGRPVLLAVAAQVGRARLIDNVVIDPNTTKPNGGLMQRQMLKSKIHRATITDCDVDYVGSITLDPELMRQADMLPNEQVHVWDIDNGCPLRHLRDRGRAGHRASSRSTAPRRGWCARATR